MSDEQETPSTEFHYHLELTPAQLKITYSALHAFLNDFTRDQPEVMGVIHEVLAKLPDEHAIRTIRLAGETERELEGKRGGPPSPGGDEPPPQAA